MSAQMSVPEDVAAWIRVRAHKANRSYAAEMREIQQIVEREESGEGFDSPRPGLRPESAPPA